MKLNAPTIIMTPISQAINKGVCVGRVPALAIAGSLVQKKKVPASSGTLPTHTPLFIAWLIGVIMIVGALSFIPALALGPIVEHLMIFAH